MRRFLLLMATMAACTTPAHAATVTGYDGSNPFDCELQQAGTGTDVPDPGADPLCIEYDKTRQNLTRAEIVPFLLGEPARFALAGDKCWYYQHDHWHGSVDQDLESTETYNWDGGYFWDKAAGVFGVYVENFTINNQSTDPTGWPGFPEPWRPHFGYGRGGVRLIDSIPVDLSCAERARRTSPYRKPAPGAGPQLRVRVRPPGRGCSRRAVRARLAGRDVRRVFRSDFRLRGRRIARERRAPFGVRIERRELGDDPSRLRVRVLMRGGERLRLAARLPAACG